MYLVKNTHAHTSSTIFFTAQTAIHKWLHSIRKPHSNSDQNYNVLLLGLTQLTPYADIAGPPKLNYAPASKSIVKEKYRHL